MPRTSLLLLLAFPAWASDTYPAAIQAKLSLAAPPPESCALCHNNGITGFGTVNTPFGRSMRTRGLVSQEVVSLNAALDALAAANVDSDRDGVTDVAELMAGTNPNINGSGTGGGFGGGGGSKVVPPPRYGCGAEVVPGLAFLAALLPLLRRRRTLNVDHFGVLAD